MNNQNLMEISPVLKKLYDEYSIKLKSGSHLHSDLEDTLNLYRDVYGTKIINNSFSEIIYHFHAITNSFDDIIDRTVLEDRKDVSIDSIIIFSSFFIVFQKIIEWIASSTDTSIPKSLLDSFFSKINENVGRISETPLKELNPRINDLDNPREEVILDIMYNRCFAYVFLGNLCDSLLKIHKIFVKDITSILILYKILEMFIRDLDENEIEKDRINNTFNVILYMESKLGIKEREEIILTLQDVVKVLEIKFYESLLKLELNQAIKLNIQFENKTLEFKKRLSNLKLIDW